MPENTDQPEYQPADTTIVFGAVPAVESPDADYARTPGLRPDDIAAIEALPPTSALLIVQSGPNSGARFLLDAEVTTAGRKPDADIFLDDVTVSRKHAEFVREPGGFAVRDTGSLNGTYVDMNRIDHCVLHGGDEVRIGKYRLTFHPSPNTESAAQRQP